jgi:hypothetical protein
MARFAEKFGQAAIKDKRMEELKGLLLGWQMRAEGAADFTMSDKEREVLKTAGAAVGTALTALGSLGKNGR